MINAYSRNRFGMDMPPWNARACTLGIPLQMTFEPCFRPSDSMAQRLFCDVEEPTEAEAVEIQQTGAVEAAPAVAQRMHTYTGKRVVNHAALAAPVPLSATPIATAALPIQNMPPPLPVQPPPTGSRFAELLTGGQVPPAKKAKKDPTLKVAFAEQI